MKQRQLLILTAVFAITSCISVPSSHAESTELSPLNKPALAPLLLPSARLSSDTPLDLKAHPLPLPQKPPEVPWLLQVVGTLALHTAEQYTKNQLDDGRPPLPDKNYANYFYPLPQRSQP